MRTYSFWRLVAAEVAADVEIPLRLAGERLVGILGDLVACAGNERRGGEEKYTRHLWTPRLIVELGSAP